MVVDPIANVSSIHQSNNITMSQPSNATMQQYSNPIIKQYYNPTLQQSIHSSVSLIAIVHIYYNAILFI